MSLTFLKIGNLLQAIAGKTSKKIALNLTVSILDSCSGAEAKALLPITSLGWANIQSQLMRRPYWNLESKAWAARKYTERQSNKLQFYKTKNEHNKFLFCCL